MAKEEKEVQTSEQTPKKKGSRRTWIITGAAVLVVLAAGAGGGVYYFTGKADAHKAQPKPSIGIIWPMEPFIVNLTDNGGERYLKASIGLEVAQQATVEELEQLKPKLRDSILDLLSAKSYADLMDMGGKQRLRDEIILRVNSFLRTGKADRVYFTELVVQ
jgi:flagellar protein FliL